MKRNFLLAICIFLAIFAFHVLGLFENLELKAIDRHFLFRGPLPPSPEVVVVAIDDESIGWLGKWPWSRTLHATLINVLESAGAKLIAFDVLFDSPSSLSDNGDAALGAAIQSAKIPVVLVSVRVVTEQGVEMNRPPLPAFTKGDNYGYPDPMVDSDGFVRAVMLQKPANDGIRDAFSLKILKKLPGFEKIKMPLESQNRLRINYAGPAHWMTTVPYDRVVDGSILKQNPGIFKNKIVFVGASAVILQDTFYTPFFNYQGEKRRMPGVEIHANELGTVLGNRYLHMLPNAWAWLLVFLMIWVSTALFFRVRAITGVVYALLEMLGFALVSLLCFRFNWILGITVPVLVGISSTYLTVVINRFIQEEREKRRIRSVFSRYVAPNVVHELLQNKESLKLGGEKKEITVFFSDIRSFTTFSESHTPEEVVAMLNEYLTAMTDVIFRCGGTLDKYVGDEIMAIWGAPLVQPNHAELAVKCCMEQLKVLRQLQQKWISEGKQPLDIGMGLNTGPMVVGNIGSPAHMDYTVIGDAVNLGARLESETRKHGTPEKPCHLIISETTHELVKHLVKTQPLGDVQVKGKTIPVKIFEVLEEEG